MNENYSQIYSQHPTTFYSKFTSQQLTAPKSLPYILNTQKNSPILNLNDKYIGDEGCKLLAEFLKDNKFFKTIELKGNNISPKGISLICKPLSFSKNLNNINLEWNNIGLGIEGLESLKILLDNNKNVRYIDLRNNKIGDSGQICNIIRNNDGNLVTFDLRWNELNNLEAQKILSAVESNVSGLKELKLNGNNISENILIEIDDALNKKGVPQDENVEEYYQYYIIYFQIIFHTHF